MFYVMRGVANTNTKRRPESHYLECTPLNYTIRCIMKRGPMKYSGALYHLIGRFVMILQRHCHTVMLATHFLRCVQLLRRR